MLILVSVFCLQVVASRKLVIFVEAKNQPSVEIVVPANKPKEFIRAIE